MPTESITVTEFIIGAENVSARARMDYKNSIIFNQILGSRLANVLLIEQKNMSTNQILQKYSILFSLSSVGNFKINKKGRLFNHMYARNTTFKGIRNNIRL